MADQLDVDARDRPIASKTEGSGNWGRRILTLLIALAALGGFAVVVVYSYDRGTQTAKDKIAPIVKAQEGPTRIRPEKPGGMAIPHQDKEIYDRLGGKPDANKVEKLLPPPEPVAPKPPPLPASASEIKTGQGESPMSPATSPTASADDATGKPIPLTPRKTPAAPPPTKIAEPPPVPSVPKPVTETRPPPPPEPKQATTPARPRPVAAPPQTVSGWKIQIASLRSEAGGRSAWDSLRRKHTDLFGGLTMNLERVEIRGKGTYFRLQAGPLKDSASARSLCAKANARKVGCLVVRP